MSDNVVLHYYPTMGLVAQWHTQTGRTFSVPIRVAISVMNDALPRQRNRKVMKLTTDIDTAENVTYFGPQTETPDAVYRVAHLMADGEHSHYRAIATGNRALVALELHELHGELLVSLVLGNPLGSGARDLRIHSAELRFEELTIGDGARYFAPVRGLTPPHQEGLIGKLNPAGTAVIAHDVPGQTAQIYLVDGHGTHGLRCQVSMSDNPTGWVRPGSGPDKAQWAIAWQLARLLKPGERHTFGGFVRLGAMSSAPTTNHDPFTLREATRPYLYAVAPATR